MQSSQSSRKLSTKLTSVLVVTVIVCTWTRVNWALETQIDLPALISQIQLQDPRADSLNATMWMPEQFWQAVFSQEPNITQTEIERRLDVFRPHVLVAVVAGELGPFGAPNFDSAATVLNKTRLVDDEHNVYEPLIKSTLSPDMQGFSSVFRPMMVQAFGPTGEAMVLVAFPARNQDGEMIADATKEGSFQVNVGDSEFKWRLPLSAVLPPKECPVDGEKMSGAWKHCPWHGVDLKEAEN